MRVYYQGLNVMPYCPRCRDEFQDWVSVCPDCGVALVKRLADLTKPENHHDPLVCIYTAPNETVAYMWADILEQHGIRSLVRRNDIMAAMYCGPFMPCEIHVLTSQAERAIKILKPFVEDN